MFDTYLDPVFQAKFFGFLGKRTCDIYSDAAKSPKFDPKKHMDLRTETKAQNEIGTFMTRIRTSCATS